MKGVHLFHPLDLSGNGKARQFRGQTRTFGQNTRTVCVLCSIIYRFCRTLCIYVQQTSVQYTCIRVTYILSYILYTLMWCRNEKKINKTKTTVAPPLQQRWAVPPETKNWPTVKLNNFTRTESTSGLVVTCLRVPYTRIISILRAATLSDMHLYKKPTVRIPNIYTEGLLRSNCTAHLSELFEFFTPEQRGPCVCTVRIPWRD